MEGQDKQNEIYLNLDSALLHLLPLSCNYGCSRHVDEGGLLAEELAEFRRIKNKKRADQFAMGRMAAHLALSKYEQQTNYCPINRSPGGAPEWPTGFVGSISHSANFALAIASNLSQHKSLGIDLEFYRKFNPNTPQQIADQNEFNIAANLGKTEKIHFFALFCAKEAVFKALSPLTNLKNFGFNSASVITVSPSSNDCDSSSFFDINLILNKKLTTEFHAGYKLLVKLYLSDSFCLTFCAIPND